MLAEVKGLPWSVKHGVRLGVKTAPEKSHSEVMILPLSNRFAALETIDEESHYGLDEDSSDGETNESVEQADAPEAASARAADTSMDGQADAPSAASASSSSMNSNSLPQPSMAVDATEDRAVRAKIGEHMGDPPPEAALVKSPRLAAIAEMAEKASDADTFLPALIV